MLTQTRGMNGLIVHSADVLFSEGFGLVEVPSVCRIKSWTFTFFSFCLVLCISMVLPSTYMWTAQNEWWWSECLFTDLIKKSLIVGLDLERFSISLFLHTGPSFKGKVFLFLWSWGTVDLITEPCSQLAHLTALVGSLMVGLTDGPIHVCKDTLLLPSCISVR